MSIYILYVKTNKETIHSSCKESLPAPDPDQYGKTKFNGTIAFSASI